MNLKNLYSEYQKLNPNEPFIANSFFDRIQYSKKKLKSEIYNMINEAIVHKDKTQLRFALAIAYRDGIDNSYTKLIAKLLKQHGMTNTKTW